MSTSRADLAAEHRPIPQSPARARPRTNRWGLVASYLVCLAIFGRTLVTAGRPELPWYLAWQAAFLLLYTVGWSRRVSPPLLGLLLGLQSAIVLAMLAPEPERDFVTGLFVVLSYQAALRFEGRRRWLWVGLFVVLIGLSLMVPLGVLRGLALALVPMAAGIIMPGYAVVGAEIEGARAESERMVAQLETTHRQLQDYAAQVEELAGMQERNRLARELHDSVSQTMFSVLLLTGSAQILLQKDPEQVRPQLAQLQELTQNALHHMRGLIADLDGGTSAE